MHYRFANVCVVAFLLTLLFLPVLEASAQCVSGTITAELQEGGPYDGLYKYTVEFTWTSPQGLSNVTLDCDFGCNSTLACEQIYMFDDPAGYSDGEPSPCQVDYYGAFNCQGNPSIGLNDPVIKWDAIDTGSCEPANTGTATLWFYTNLGPNPNSPLPIVIEKDGQNVCSGIVLGDCPALCTVPVKNESWGALKNLFR